MIMDTYGNLTIHLETSALIVFTFLIYRFEKVILICFILIHTVLYVPYVLSEGFYWLQSHDVTYLCNV